MSVELTYQQAAAVEDRGGELLVSAAAGSGKTRILVERLMRRVEEEGLNLDQFLIITYTKAAAAELRGKILAELNERLGQDPGNAQLRRQKLIIYRAQISTIHSFCTALLREDGYRLDLGEFRVGEDNECAVLKDKALKAVLEERYQHMDEKFTRLVDTFSQGRDDARLEGIVLDIHARVQSHPDPAGWLEEQTRAFDVEEGQDIGDTPWGRVLLEDAGARGKYWADRFQAILDSLWEDATLNEAYSVSFTLARVEILEFVQALDRGWNDARDHCQISFPKLKPARNVDTPRLRDEAQAAWNDCKKWAAKLQESFADTSQDLIRDLRQVYPVADALKDLVLDFDRQYTLEKRRRSVVDFEDLEHLAYRLLQDPEVAQKWGDRYAEVMVDEYQDTNLVQNHIFNAVSGDGVRLFQVGDVKQSIYRFRLADPTIFLRKYNTYPNAPDAGEGKPRKLVLSYNFRSRASVLEGVNFVFAHIMSAEFGEMDYTEDQRLYPKLPYPDQPMDAVELDVVDMEDLVQETGKAKLRKDAVEAQFVASRIRTLLDTEYPITEGDHFRPVQPEDIAILYRSPGSVMRYLSEALNKYRIPWTSDGSGDFFEAQEVCTAIAFLELVDNPRQDVPLLSVLTCPVYHFTGDDLAFLRAGHPEGELYDCLTAAAQAGHEKSRAFLHDLNALREAAPDMPGYRLLGQIYESTGLLAVYGAMEGGALRQENLRLLYEYARSFEQTGYQGVFGLVTQLRRLRESGQDLPSGGGQEGTGVRVMSIHKSKGLEFPVVLVAGLNRNFNRTDQYAPVVFHPTLGMGPNGVDLERGIEFPTVARRAVTAQLDREMKAEEMRLLYVAMTRAREKLILVSTTQSWATQAKRLAPDTGPHPDPEALNRQTTVADWILTVALGREDAAVLRRGGDVTCDPIQAQDTWDIRLVAAPTPGAGRYVSAGHTEDASGEPNTHLTLEDLARLSWTYPYAALADTPSKATATQLKGRTLDAEVAEDAQVPPRPMEFPRPRFDQAERGLTANQIGTAVHTVMQLIRLDRADREDLVREEIARLVDQESLTPQEAAAVKPRQIAAFFASPLGREARNAPDLKREFKFSLLTSAALLNQGLPPEEQILLQGVIDCCFTGSAGLTVVDFKTDYVRPGEELLHSQRYRTQLDVYTQALSRIMGVPVGRRVVWYLGTGQGAEV